MEVLSEVAGVQSERVLGSQWKTNGRVEIATGSQSLHLKLKNKTPKPSTCPTSQATGAKESCKKQGDPGKEVANIYAN